MLPERFPQKPYSLSGNGEGRGDFSTFYGKVGEGVEPYVAGELTSRYSQVACKSFSWGGRNEGGHRA